MARASCPFLLFVVVCALISGCSDPMQDLDAKIQLESRVQISDVITTVATVSGRVVGEPIDEVYLEFGGADWVREQSIELDENGAFHNRLLGLKPLHDYSCRVIVVSDGVELVGEELPFETGPVPSSLPTFTITEHMAGRAPEGYLVTSLMGNSLYSVVIDTDGDLVWWAELPDGVTATTKQSVDGEYIYGIARQALQKVRIGGEQTEQIDLPGIHHEFVELPDGSIAYLAYDMLASDDLGGAMVQGVKVMELMTDGTVHETFSLWDHQEWGADDFEEENGDYVLGHANAIGFVPEENAYYVSFLFFESIWKIDRATGEVIWKMGGKDSDYDLAGGLGTEVFAGASHGFQRLDQGIVVFHNGLDEQASSVAEYDFSEPERELVEVWSYTPHPPIATYVLGDTARLDNDTTLITWSTAGQIDIITADAELAWSLNAPLGVALGYTAFVESL